MINITNYTNQITERP